MLWDGGFQLLSMDLIVSSSPSPDIVMSRYAPDLFPKFRAVFEPDKKIPFPIVATDPAESELALVLENQSSRDLTALRFRWVMTSEDGKLRNHTVSSDSYFVDVYSAVLKKGDRKLITPNTSIDESFLDHLASGGGGIGAGLRGRRSLENVASLKFEIDFLLFEDGEIAGPDPDRFASELNCRKPAAEFIARHIRLAEKEDRDVTPVLNALAELPHLGGDQLAKWTQRYASEFLSDMNRKIGNLEMREVRLRHLENRPSLPKFYRRKSEF
jgi:hypothetical protein